VGNGAATAVAWPLLTALIPPEKTGVFAGLKAATESISIPLSVVVAAELFLPWLGYRGIFAMLAVSITLALVLLLCFVRLPGPTDSTRPNDGIERHATPRHHRSRSPRRMPRAARTFTGHLPCATRAAPAPELGLA
jgi:hypothetical protein